MNPNTYFGTGKADELKHICASVRADLVIFYNTLSEKQCMVLAEITGTIVLDRTDIATHIAASNN